MKKLKQIIVTLLMCCMIIIPMTACENDNKVSGIVQSYQIYEETESIIIQYKSDVDLQDTYYYLRVTDEDLCKYDYSLSEFLNDKSVINLSRHGFDGSLWTENGQTGMHFHAYECNLYILIYPFSYLPEDKTLFDYVGKIELDKYWD